MPVTIRSYRCFPVPCSVACNEGPFFRLPLNYFLGFWLLITLLVLGSRPVYAGWELTSGDDETHRRVDFVISAEIQHALRLREVWKCARIERKHSADLAGANSSKRGTHYYPS